MKKFFDKKVTMKSILIIVLILVVVSLGGYFGKKYYKKSQDKKLLETSKTVIGSIARMSIPVNGQCRVINLEYFENGTTTTEQVINVTCVNKPSTPIPTPIPVPKPMSEPEPTEE